MGITNAGLAGYTGVITADVTAPTYLAMGTGATAYAATQTALVTETSASGLARAVSAVTRVTTTQSNDTLQYLKTFTVTGTISPTEVGIFNAASTGTMFQRALFSPAPSLVSGDAYTLIVQVKMA